jgi:hypothetical protein
MGVATYLINRRIKDQQLRDVMANVIENGLGVAQQAATGTVLRVNPQLRGVVSGKWAPGVQYVLNHAAEAITRFHISAERIEEKLIAAEGKKEIQSNMALTASSTPLAVSPIGPMPSSQEITAAELNRQELQRVQAQQGVVR